MSTTQPASDIYGCRIWEFRVWGFVGKNGKSNGQEKGK